MPLQPSEISDARRRELRRRERERKRGRRAAEPRPRLAGVGLPATVLIVALAAVMGVWIGAGKQSDEFAVHNPAGPRPGGREAGPPRLVARAAGRLRQPKQDGAAVALGGGGALVLGGLDARSNSLTDVERHGGSGLGRLAGALPTPLHDAAAAMAGGAAYVFGGGQVASFDRIVRVNPPSGRASVAARLPGPRSDLGAAAIADRVYLVGGYDGTRALDTILSWRPGRAPTVAGRLPRALRYAAVASARDRLIVIGGSTASGTASRDVLAFDPRTRRTRSIGRLPAGLTHAGAATMGGYVFAIGGRGARPDTPTDRVLSIDPVSGRVRQAGRLPRPLSDVAATSTTGGILVLGGRTGGHPVDTVTRLAPAPRRRTGAPRRHHAAARPTLQPGSDPRALPGNILIADKANNRLLEVTPRGRVVWRFPRPGDLRRGQTFKVPDDAFFTADGRRIVATQEDDFVVSVIDMATHRIVYRYGTPGVPGAGPNHVYNPDDALPLPHGRTALADIKNCRLLVLRPPSHRPLRQIGAPGGCGHAPPRSFGSPNGAFPASHGRTIVTEINGDWVDVLGRGGRLVSATHVPGFSYPSDTNEVGPDVYLSADYAVPGTLATFDGRGRLLWRYSPRGPGALAKPSLALPLPNGDVLANDDANDRVIVVDPRHNRIVWQYGHRGRPGRRAGYLNVPDGVDLAPPHSLMRRFAHARPPG